MTLQIPTLQIADIDLPQEVERLRDLAYDLWWSFNPKASRLFAWIDPEHWRRYHNPVELLINVDPHKWVGLLKDNEFLGAYHQAIESLEASRSARKFIDDQPDLHILPRPERAVAIGKAGLDLERAAPSIDGIIECGDMVTAMTPRMERCHHCHRSHQIKNHT